MGLLDLTRTIEFQYKPDDESEGAIPVKCEFKRLRGSEALQIRAEYLALGDDVGKRYTMILGLLNERVRTLTVCGESVSGADVKDALELLGVTFVFELWSQLRDESGAGGMVPKSKHSPAT